MTLGAVVVAAGLSQRMGGTHKGLLPWGAQGTILSTILTTLASAELSAIRVVTGHQRQAIEAVVRALPHADVSCVFNAGYEAGEMLSSVQVGLQALPDRIAAALIVLGDQPRLQVDTLSRLHAAHRAGQGQIVIPSYNMRRGHPLLIPRQHWAAICVLGAGQTLRHFLRDHAASINHVVIDNDSILSDIDTPQDYQAARDNASD
jgi:molybdenum cofactor cytidylyltransferase